MATTHLIVCEHCDSVHQRLLLKEGETALCQRCGAELYHSRRLDLNRMLALTLTALIVFVIANAYPIADIELQGRSNSARLWDAILLTYDSGVRPIAIVAAGSAFFLPLAQILLFLYVLIPLRAGFVPREFALAMRVLRLARPWSMVEVFLIGTLVSVVKLHGYAGVTPEPGLWGFAVLTMLQALLQNYHLHELWDYADEIGRAERVAQRVNTSGTESGT